MRLWAEIPAFGAMAIGLHLALFAGWPGGAPEAAGDGGAATVTVTGSTGAVEAMVAAWDAPPSTVETVSRPEALPDTAPPPAPSRETAPDRGEATDLAAILPDASPATLPETPHPLRAPSLSHAGPVPAAPGAAAAPSAPTSETAVPRPDMPRRDDLPKRAETPPEAEAPPAPAHRPRARPAQVAQGDGGTGVRGVRNDAPAPGLSEGARRSVVASWGAEIRARIEARKVHPEGLKASGRPVVRITVARSGALEDVRIVRSSRVAALDEAAVRAVRRAGRFPAAPGELDLARVSFDLPISFTR